MQTTARFSLPPMPRLLSVAGNILFWIVFALALFLAYGSVPNRFYQVLLVSSGSMSPTFEAGDLIVVTRPPERLQPGMVLTMLVNGEIVTHRLMEIAPDGSLLTQGDANTVADEWTEADIEVRGLYRFRIPRLGLALNAPMQWLRGHRTGSWFSDADEVPFLIQVAWPTPSATPADPNCVRSAGYWANHADRWPVDRLTLGGRELGSAELLALLQSSPRGDATLILARQAVAALLNRQAGADVSAIQAALEETERFLATFPPGSDPKDKNLKQIATRLADSLDAFNTGRLGPIECQEDRTAATPSPTLPATPTPAPSESPLLPALPSPESTIIPIQTETPVPMVAITPVVEQPTATLEPTELPTVEPTSAPTEASTEAATEPPVEPTPEG